MYKLKVSLNGAVRTYHCETIADAEALQDIFARLGYNCVVL